MSGDYVIAFCWRLAEYTRGLYDRADYLIKANGNVFIQGDSGVSTVLLLASQVPSPLYHHPLPRCRRSPYLYMIVVLWQIWYTQRSGLRHLDGGWGFKGIGGESPAS